MVRPIMEELSGTGRAFYASAPMQAIAPHRLERDDGWGFGNRKISYRRAPGNRFDQPPGTDSSMANLANFSMAAFVRNGKRPATASFAIPCTSDQAYNVRSIVFPAGNWPSA